MKNLLGFAGLFFYTLVMAGCGGDPVEKCEFRANLCSQRIAEVANGNVTKLAAWTAVGNGTQTIGCYNDMIVDSSGDRLHNDFLQSRCKLENGTCVIDTAYPGATELANGKLELSSGSKIDLKAICAAAGVAGCKKTEAPGLISIMTDDHAKANTGSFCHIVKR